jgi:O-antigen ligase
MIKPIRFIQSGLTALVALMPFHAFVSILIGSLLGHQTVIQSWKEILLLAMGLAAGWHFLRHPNARQVLRQPINLLILLYFAVSALVSLVFGQIGSPSWWYGAKANLAFFVIFILAQIASTEFIKSRLLKITLVTSLAVAAIAIVQAWLPVDWLRAVGYSSANIEPIQLIDPAIAAKRAFSTLGGPNQLGAFLILPLSLFFHRFLAKRRFLDGGAAALIAVAMILTFSRSAWVGAVIAVGAVIWLHTPRKHRKFFLVAASTAAVIATSVVLFLARQPGQLQYFVLHSQNQTYGQLGSDAERLQALKQGLSQAIARPFGNGLGTAGPSSLYGPSGLIPENYYLQISLEAGFIALVLFIGIIALTARHLLQLPRSDSLSLPLFGALVGVSAVNLFLHTWTDSTLAYTYWALAGIAVGQIHLQTHTTNVNPS